MRGRKKMVSLYEKKCVINHNLPYKIIVAKIFFFILCFRFC